MRRPPSAIAILAPRRQEATDPASADPGLGIAKFARLWLGRCARSVLKRWRPLRAERVREGRRPSRRCPTDFLTNRSGRAQISFTKRNPKAILRSVLKELPLIEQISVAVRVNQQSPHGQRPTEIVCCRLQQEYEVSW